MRRFSAARLVAAGSVLAGAVALASAVPALAVGHSAGHQGGHGDAWAGHYLALGDSVPFGYNPLRVKPGVKPGVFVGYPELAARMHDGGLKLANAACPGETSTSLIAGTRPDNGCQDYRQFIGKLHRNYTGSQLAYAEAFVAKHHDTKFISMSIGANDVFVLQHSCATAPSPNTCVLAGLPGVLDTIKNNLATIYTGLRAAGFTGDFVAVTYYSTNYSDPFTTGAVGALDQVLAGVTTAFGGKVADGFGAFQAAAAAFGGDSCAAGLLIRLPDNTCDVHPTRSGALLLAKALRTAVGAAWPCDGDHHEGHLHGYLVH